MRRKIAAIVMAISMALAGAAVIHHIGAVAHPTAASSTPETMYHG